MLRPNISTTGIMKIMNLDLAGQTIDTAFNCRPGKPSLLLSSQQDDKYFFVMAPYSTLQMWQPLHDDDLI